MVKQYLSRFLFNIPGWRTKRKIIVIESDDWGSIRMPSRDVYEKFLKEGYPVDRHLYERYDSITSGNDLELLFDLLKSFKDSKDNSPVITANCVVANPDFEKIRAGNFSNYYFELISETFKKYPEHHQNLELWKQGDEAGVFHPQYHGREHVNVSLLMDALQKGDRDAHFSFENNVPGSIPNGVEVGGNSYVMAMRYTTLADKEEKLKIFLEGLDLFEDLFGYRSLSIIPPVYTWSPDFDRAVFEKGVRYIQGIRLMHEPVVGSKSKYHRRHLGIRNSLGQISLIRNAIFEPTLKNLGINDPVSTCLSEINIAFKLNKPAIICSHRINYVGYLDTRNRDNSLELLGQVLSKALKRWPDIEFMTTDQLGKLIEESDEKTS